MGDPRNGFELLKKANPVDVDQVLGADSEAARTILASIVQEPQPETSVRRPGRRPVRLAIALAAMTLVLIAATWLLTRNVENPQAIACHQAVDTDSDIAAAPTGGPATADACIPVWEDGIIENPEVAPLGSLPPLTACVTERGNLAVFPTDDQDVCASLGLAYPEPASQDDANQIRQLDSDLQAYFSSKECASMQEAETRVPNMLDDAGFDTWTIQTQQASDERPCASYSLTADTETIHLVPIPAQDN